jgi:hypothetical protein
MLTLLTWQFTRYGGKSLQADRLFYRSDNLVTAIWGQIRATQDVNSDRNSRACQRNCLLLLC